MLLITWKKEIMFFDENHSIVTNVVEIRRFFWLTVLVVTNFLIRKSLCFFLCRKCEFCKFKQFKLISFRTFIKMTCSFLLEERLRNSFNFTIKLFSALWTQSNFRGLTNLFSKAFFNVFSFAFPSFWKVSPFQSRSFDETKK